MTYLYRYYFSKKTGGFYDYSEKEIYELSENGWPSDAVGITDSEYKSLLDGQASGKVVASDDGGRPVLNEPPELTHAELVIISEARRSELMSEATGIIAPLQDAVDMNISTKQEQKKLDEWKKYRVMLNRTDVSLAPDIMWPEKPS
ncbi:tail fiber assembly protein [uncultured Serratia sp.]|uniref:tail fiber assembly protein n=1 Tax=uncultured Serratia sp. TaxID=239175 RepID=UPI002583DAE1|nr:tail fiber assembly protein [uncultured Serratia sp.]